MQCGIGDYTALLAQAMSRYTNLKIAVLTHTSISSTLTPQNIETLAIAENWSWAEIGQLLSAIKQWKPNIIHFQFPTQGYGKQKLPWVLPLALATYGYPIVQTWHEYVLQNQGLADWKNCLLYLPNVLTPGGLIVVRPDYTKHLPSIYRLLVASKELRFIPNASAIPSITLLDKTRQEIRNEIAEGQKFIAYFGFALPAKGVELLFEVLDPQQHYLVLICELNQSDAYHAMLLERIRSTHWSTKSKVTGFLGAEHVGRLLAAADAIILPFRKGGGSWNTSLQAASQQGTFVLTTSNEQHGYDEHNNIYYAQPDNLAEMRQALATYTGHRIPAKNSKEWERIARDHVELYSKVVSR